MNRRIILRFRSAGQAGAVSEFPLSEHPNLTLGRDPSCNVAFEVNQDLVSRQHAKISASGGDSPSFTIADLGSSNGTFVNHQRISSAVRLTPGDVVELGAGGPEFVFDLEPRVPAATRLGMDLTVPVQVAPPTHATRLTTQPESKPHAQLGKATVERMIAETSRTSSRRMLMSVGGGLLGVIAIASGLLSFPSVRNAVGLHTGPRGLTAAEVAKSAGDSVVFVEVGWKLLDMETGSSLYQRYMDNKVPAQPAQQQQQAPDPPAQTGAQANAQPLEQPAAQVPPPQPEAKEIVPGGPARLPVFVVVEGALEPMLVTDAGEGKNRPIGGRHSGSGFVATADGFILTNRHVASAWLTLYDFTSPVGLVLQDDGQGNQKLTPIAANQFPRWVPGRARFIVRGRLNPNSPLIGRAISGKAVEGRNDYLDVTFPRNRERVEAKLVRVSDQADVAMVKVDMPHALRKLELYDNYNIIAQGDEVSVLGYPAVSPTLIGAVQSNEALAPTTEVRVIPDPTLSIGNIGRLIRGRAGLTESVTSTFGDVYQLTINSTGRGNSGGPVFDNNGRVIGLFTYSAQADALITFAVPIRYGLELMGTKAVM